MQIIVGYDGSNVSFSALNLAIKHAKSFGSEVHIVTSFIKGGDRQQLEISESKKNYCNQIKQDAIINAALNVRDNFS
jgi:hypothetical protein